MIGICVAVGIIVLVIVNYLKNNNDNTLEIVQKGNIIGENGNNKIENTGDNKTENETNNQTENGSASSDTDENNNAITEQSICVHISGEVCTPGILILNENSRVIDAIEAAGGLTNNADISCVNLAYIISDGMKICIPNFEQVKLAQIEYITKENGEGVISSDTDLNLSSNSNLKTNKKVNINTATQAELETLTGIGPSIASKIVEYRKQNGKFGSIDDIKNVSGIGNSKFNSICNNICI